VGEHRQQAMASGVLQAGESVEGAHVSEFVESSLPCTALASQSITKLLRLKPASPLMSNDMIKPDAAAVDHAHATA
jgi:hypothetical protein